MKRKLIASIVLIVFVFWYTNPSESQYVNYMLKRQVPDVWTADKLKQISDVVHSFSVRQNYIVFSVFDYRLVEEKRGGVHKRYIGVFNQIFNLSSEDIPPK